MKLYDHELCEMNKLKFEIYKNACRTHNFDEYWSVRSRYKKLIKLKKRQYLQNKINEAKYDQAKMWKCLKNLLKWSVNQWRKVWQR